MSLGGRSSRLQAFHAHQSVASDLGPSLCGCGERQRGREQQREALGDD